MVTAAATLLPGELEPQGMKAPNLFEILKKPEFQNAKVAYSSFNREKGHYETRMIRASDIEQTIKGKKDTTLSWGFTECLGEDRCPLIDDALAGVGSVYGTGYGRGEKSPDEIASIMVSVNPAMNGKSETAIENFIAAARKKNRETEKEWTNGTAARIDVKHDIIAIFPNSLKDVIQTEKSANISVDDQVSPLNAHTTVILGFDKSGDNKGFIPASLRSIARQKWQEKLGLGVGMNR